jgi:hypothetical protein
MAYGQERIKMTTVTLVIPTQFETHVFVSDCGNEIVISQTCAQGGDDDIVIIQPMHARAIAKAIIAARDAIAGKGVNDA